MPSWASRLDGGIRAGHLYFFCFKRRQSGDGSLILLNSRHWFDGQAWRPTNIRRGDERPRPRRRRRGALTFAASVMAGRAATAGFSRTSL